MGGGSIQAICPLREEHLLDGRLGIEPRKDGIALAEGLCELGVGVILAEGLLDWGQTDRAPFE
jgi:hypothetical protein